MSIPSNIPPNYAKALEGMVQAAEAQKMSMEKVDPTGVWTKFLGQSGAGIQPTPEQVKAFINGILKMLAIEIKREAKKMKEVLQEQKRAASGG